MHSAGEGSSRGDCQRNSAISQFARLWSCGLGSRESGINIGLTSVKRLGVLIPIIRVVVNSPLLENIRREEEIASMSF